MENQIVKIEPQQYGLQEKDAQNLTTGLNPILQERDLMMKIYQDVLVMDIEDPLTSSKARELRLQLRDNRTKGIIPWHKNAKEFFLRGGQFVDAIKNKEIQANEAMEERLEQIEKHYEIKEKERKETIHKERIEKIMPYVEDITGLDFRDMPDDIFDAYFSTKVKIHNERIEAEKRAEEERLEAERKVKLHTERKEKLLDYWQYLNDEKKNISFGEIEENAFYEIVAEVKKLKEEALAEAERIRIDNERLAKEKAEAEERERKIREQAEAERKALEEKARLEKEQAEAKAKKRKRRI